MKSGLDARRRRCLPAAVTIGLLCSAGLFAREPLQLEDYLQLAVEHSPELKAAAVRLNAAEADIEALPRRYLPDLYLEAGYGGAANTRENRTGPLARVVGAWTLWDGGRSEAERAVFEREREVQKFSEQARALGIRKTLALAYYRAARLIELQAIARAEIAAYERLARSLGPRRRIGSAGASDVLNARLRAGALRAESAANAETILALRSSLLILAGLETGADSQNQPPEIPRLRDSFSPPTGDSNESNESGGEQSSARFVEQHPSFVVEQARLRLLKARQALVERELYGTTLALEVYGGYGPDLDAIDPNRPEAGAGLRFRFPLFASRDRESRMQAGQARIEAAILETRQRMLELRIELGERRAGISRDRRLLAEVTALTGQARRALRLAYAEFGRGQKAPADMIAAIETLHDLERKSANTLFRLRLARFEEYALSGSRPSPQSSKNNQENPNENSK